MPANDRFLNELNLRVVLQSKNLMEDFLVAESLSIFDINSMLILIFNVNLSSGPIFNAPFNIV